MRNAPPEARMYCRPGDLRRFDEVAARMRAYREDKLVGVTAQEFKGELARMMGVERADFQHHTDASVQRRQSVAFSWGHDHDFGSFSLRGEMTHRHIRHMCVFAEHFGRRLEGLSGREVLEIGPWTGGVSLMLASYGARVHAVEEVLKYVEVVRFLASSFGLENIGCECKSLYDLTTEEYQDRFDVCMFAGVLYHVTDPIVALRVLFNTLKDGGECWVETTGWASEKAVWGYERRAWNWFDPSPSALKLVMEDVGFRGVKVGPVTPDGRLYAVGTREEHVDIRRDGLSVPRLR